MRWLGTSRFRERPLPALDRAELELLRRLARVRERDQERRDARQQRDTR